MYIGGRELKKDFENKIFEVPLDTRFFLFTDGYADQNNAKRKKFNGRNFKTMLETHATLPFEEQVKIYNQKLDEHQGDVKQRDDISLIGLTFGG